MPSRASGGHIPFTMPAMRRVAVLLASLFVVAFPLAAQVKPDLDWRTLGTTHFRIHFSPGLDDLARRTAANAEFAYARLATELVPPRGPIDIVVADNVDYANGYATPYPSNRIVIYARPPVESMSLRNHVDWNLSLVTHELAHIFHLDRTRGWWRVAQSVFGRAAPFFPNTYSPSWVVEGLAVHYETRFAGGGRLSGTEFPAMARAAAIDEDLPALHELSLAAPRFPGGNVAYVYGSFAMTRPRAGALGRFVEVSSGRVIPWRINANARAAFGESFSDYWARWRDSVTTSVVAVAGSDSRDLTDHGFEARFPRFLDDTTLIYVANDARQTTGLYRLADDAAAPHRERLGRRNGIDANSPLDRRRTVQGELEWSDPWTLRSDLYLGAGASHRRLTRNERLSSPDVHRATRRVVAVQTIPGSTQLVTMNLDGDEYPRLLVAGTLDRNWSDPRWSHDGTRIAAARWERGGRASIVVLDSKGRTLREFSPRALSVVSSPVWAPGDTTILFVSDHEGRATVYRGDVRTGGFAPVWRSATALHTPDISPSGERIAAVELRGDGYRVVTRDMPGAIDLPMPAADSAADTAREATALMLPADTTAEESRYSAFHSLLPQWWLPVVTSTDLDTRRFGILTGGHDVIGRHAYAASLEVDQRRELTADVGYSWAGLGNPILTASATQGWHHAGVQNQAGAPAGMLIVRERSARIAALVERPRVRLSTYAVLAAEVEEFVFSTDPDSLLERLNNAAYRRPIRTELFEAEVGLSTMQRPGLAVSVEDGFALAFTQRARLGVGVQFEDVQEQIVTMSAAKSLPLPGYARHVVAVRGAYGVTGHRTTNAFSAGGVSGSQMEILNGITVGGARRTFFVRGFESSAQIGVRAAAGSVEYRAPLFLGGRGLSFLPVFFQKASLTAFADGGGAWCSFSVADSFICPAPVPPSVLMASVGGELALDAALQYDQVYRLRLGVAHPVKGQEHAARTTTLYFTLGSTF